ncbi:unnamed protein product, partial [Polarella glacialis]
ATSTLAHSCLVTAWGTVVCSFLCFFLGGFVYALVPRTNILLYFLGCMCVAASHACPWWLAFLSKLLEVCVALAAALAHAALPECLAVLCIAQLASLLTRSTARRRRRLFATMLRPEVARRPQQNSRDDWASMPPLPHEAQRLIFAF